MNAQWIDLGWVEIRHGSVSKLPFADACSISSRPWKHTSGGGTSPVTCAKSSRVLKPGGTLIVIAEIYKGVNPWLESLRKNSPHKQA